MSEKNFNKQSLLCPNCSVELVTCDTQSHEWSPSGGLTSRKGPRVCVSCHRAVDLSIAIGCLQVAEKKAEVARLQEEIAAASHAYGGVPEEVEDGGKLG